MRSLLACLLAYVQLVDLDIRYHLRLVLKTQIIII